MADRYISEKALIENIAKIEDLRKLSTKTIGEAISNTPTADVVEGKAIEQLKWERDTAIAQLESYGVGFCENKELTVVKHGEWRRDLNFYPYCTVCGENPWSAIKPEGNLKYCPYCGAIMDGGGV